MKQMQRFLTLALSFLLAFGLLVPAVCVPDAAAGLSVDRLKDLLKEAIPDDTKDDIQKEVEKAVTVTVYVDGKQLSLDQPPVMKNGHTLVPVRAIFNALGAEVEWDPSAKQVMSTKGNVAALLTIDSTIMTVGTIGGTATDKTLDVAPIILNNKVFVPLRAVSEAFDCDVSWNGTLKRIDIYTKAESDQGDDSSSDKGNALDSSGKGNALDSSGKGNQPETPISTSDSVAVDPNRIYFNPSRVADFYPSAIYEGNTLYFNFVKRPELYVYNGSSVRAFKTGDSPCDIIVRNGQVYYYGNSNQAVYHLDTANGNREALLNQDSKMDITNLVLYRDYLLVSIEEKDHKDKAYAVNVNTGESNLLCDPNLLYDTEDIVVLPSVSLMTAAGGKAYILSHVHLKDSLNSVYSIIEADPVTGYSRTLYTDVGESLFCAADGSGIYFYEGDEDESKVYYFHDASTNKRQVVSESEYNNAETEYKQTNDSTWQDDWTFDSNINTGVSRKNRDSGLTEILYSGKGCAYLTNNQSQVAFIQSEEGFNSGSRNWGHTAVHVIDINGNDSRELINNGEDSGSSSSGGGTNSGSSNSGGSTNSVQEDDECELCDGKGVVTCYYCHGSGQGQTIYVMGMPTPQKCTYCGGTGKRLCPGCNGSGKKGGAK